MEACRPQVAAWCIRIPEEQGNHDRKLGTITVLVTGLGEGTLKATCYML